MNTVNTIGAILPLRLAAAAGWLVSMAILSLPLLPQAAAQPAPLVVDLGSVQWGAPGGGGGFPVGVQTATLGTDTQTGGVTYYARFPAGSLFELHWHTHHEYVVVVQGRVDLTMDGSTHALEPGSYIVIPGQVNHSWDVPDDTDVIILVRRAGPADFHFVE